MAFVVSHRGDVQTREKDYITYKLEKKFSSKNIISSKNI